MNKSKPSSPPAESRPAKVFPPRKGRPRSTPVAGDATGEAGGNGIRAMVVGLAVLRAVGSAPRAQPLREIASASGLTPSRVHRYLSSLLAAGFIEQDARSGHYSLGQAVIEIGLQALGQLDPIRIGVQALQSHSEHSGLDGHLSVWGSHGPTTVRWQSGLPGLQIKVEEGRVLPILWSATGRLMAAYRRRVDIAPLLNVEMNSWNREHPNAQIREDQIEEIFAAVRSRGYASSIPKSDKSPGSLLDLVVQRPDHIGLEIVAVPIFDRQGQVPLALTFFGTEQVPLLKDGSGRITAIVEAARAASRRMGHTPP